MKGIIYYAPTAQRAKHVSHSNVGAEHCSALIDQRDKTLGHCDCPAEPGAGLRVVESHDAELAHEVELAAVVFGELAACRSSGKLQCYAYPTETCFQKGLSLCRNSRKACFAFKCLVRCITHSASGRFFALRFLSVLRSIRFTACSWLFNFRPGFGRAGRRGLRRTGSLLRLPRAGRGEPWYPNYRFS